MMRGRALSFLVATIVVVCAGAGPVRAEPKPNPRTGALQIHVRGATELHAIATADHGQLTLHGELIDDAGTPVAAARIAISALAQDGRTAVRIGPLRSCDENGTRPVPRGGPDELSVDTDERGGFCVIGSPPEGSAAAFVTLRFAGSRFHDAADARATVEAAEEHLLRTSLRFEPPVEAIDLDRETVTITAALHIDRSDAPRPGAPSLAGSAQRANLPLVLTDERGAHVASAVTSGDGRARFEVKTAALAGPGVGELTARFAGNAVLGKAEWSQPIVRRADARLALVSPPALADPEDGVAVDVDVTTARGPVSGGVVEVRRLAAREAPGEPSGDETVGATMVDAAGRAHVVAVFSAGGAPRATLALRYVPATPWHRPGAELRVDAELAGPGIGRSLLLGALVAAAAIWVLVGWRRAPRPPVVAGLEGTQAAPSGRAGVRVVASPSDLAGWRGTVTDAHDGSAIGGASLSIVTPSFEGDGVVARATADEHGAFTLDGSFRKDARLVVESALHARHEQALPPPSVLGVALVLRRRALVDRLVRWARQKGAPFDGPPEPTPGHVRRVASRASAVEIESWASQVEHAAYGPRPVDANLERDIRSREPADGGARPPGAPPAAG